MSKRALNRPEGVLLPLDCHVTGGRRDNFERNRLGRVSDPVSFFANLNRGIQVVDNCFRVRLHKVATPCVHLTVESATAVERGLTCAEDFLDRPVQGAPCCGWVTDVFRDKSASNPAYPGIAEGLH